MPVKRSVTTHAVIHHSASDPLTTTKDDFYQWHVVENGWDDIGYNLIIWPNGTIDAGRDLSEQGAHAPPLNQTSVGICLVGYGPDFTDAQFDALDDTISFLERRYPGIQVVGHKDVKPTECPGFAANLWAMQRV